jgi:hypothetical protein
VDAEPAAKILLSLAFMCHHRGCHGACFSQAEGVSARVQEAGHVQQLDLGKQDLLGSVELSLAEVVQAIGTPKQWPLEGSHGSITVTAEEVVEFKKSLKVTIKCGLLAKLELYQLLQCKDFRCMGRGRSLLLFSTHRYCVPRHSPPT